MAQTTAEVGWAVLTAQIHMEQAFNNLTALTVMTRLPPVRYTNDNCFSFARWRKPRR